MVTNISHSPAETAALGEAWGHSVQRGLVIGLCGDLGAGKTQLVKGLARGLGVKARVHSPTFALVNVYSGGRLPLFHLDLYRLETREQILAAGLDEYLDPNGIAVIEWAERWFGEKPSQQSLGDSGRGSQAARIVAPRRESLRWVHIEIISESDRCISYEDLST
jgi:tRNA threonylcarbamoyladenosine biosynthesis protein TsaE